MKCEECRELDIRPEYNGCVCAYSIVLKMPIKDGLRTDDYLWCEGRGFRPWEKSNGEQ